MRQTGRDQKRGGQGEEKRGTSREGRVSEIEKGISVRKEKKRERKRKTARKKTTSERRYKNQ